eukprot:gnl/TRDRNA2_/TRDRNA2_140605_c0_seq2.p1 gnl/TRDRNA2_/TRDRNA2_140605_c0~~gnl/TRDRNA2_/TRDRNA2_140605_c0_seq2.p1  ORF type:complete len:113 (+),score=11.33 gnl/TRDRNA2_/TRDRNA2_140605_c0_seq2:37-375(+)
MLMYLQKALSSESARSLNCVRTSLPKVPTCGNCSEDTVETAYGILEGHFHATECDRCEREIPRTERRWRCDTCDFDLCLACAQQDAVGRAAADGRSWVACSPTTEITGNCQC